jgi:hypothetical protein
MFNYISDALVISAAANTQAISGTGTTVGMIDVSNAVGPILITTISPSGGTGTMTITPVMNTTNSTSGTTVVPANALVVASGAIGTVYAPGATNSPGQPATFASVAAAASVQTLAVLRELSQRYIGVTLGGTGLTQTVTIVVTYMKQYTL